jgi:LCP family protein required for cell wall assembly
MTRDDTFSTEDATSSSPRSFANAKLWKKFSLKAHLRTKNAKKPALQIISSIVCFLAVFAATLFSLAYIGIDMGLKKADDLVQHNPQDPEAGNSINILVMGVDNREGDNEEIAGGEVGNENSDTNILIHISSDRTRADFISIPRDSMVELPVCHTRKGDTEPQSLAMFNSAFPTGFNLGGDLSSGASCTVQTLEENTGLHIDGYVVLDFNGFMRMIDALGGVEVCIKEEIFSESARGLHLYPGCQKLDGWHATEYARARTGQGLGDGSDISRIERQQGLIIDIMKTAMKKNLLTDTTELYRFADSAAESITTTYSLNSLIGIAYSLRSINLSNIDLITVPWVPWPEDTNRIIWSDEAKTLWQEVRKNQKITVEGVRNIVDSDSAVSDGESSGSGDSGSGESGS